MFEGMVIDGKCLELALEPQNEKAPWDSVPVGLALGGSPLLTQET